MTKPAQHERDKSQPATKKPPPIAGTVAGRAPVPSIAENEEPASPGR